MACYGQDRLSGSDMMRSTTDNNKAAARYGFTRFGLSSPDGAWTFGNDGIANDENPRPCSEEDSKDIPYLTKIFEFIEQNPSQFDNDKIYAVGFSQNSMFSAYTAFCFPDKVIGLWQGGSGMATKETGPDLPGMQGQCSASSFAANSRNCLTIDPCTDCQYWPIYPCYNEQRPMIDCVNDYDNDQIANDDDAESAIQMYDALLNEGHDARLIRWSPSEDGTIEGSHTDPKNLIHWQVGCLGITSPCSEECETELISCVNSGDTSTALNRAETFGDCIDAQSTDCEGCAPTLAMLSESQAPTVQLGNFGAADYTLDHDKPDTSLCEV